VTAEAAPGAGVVAAADAALGADAAVDAVLRAAAVAWGAGAEAALGADETADIDIATSKIWRTCAKGERTDREALRALDCGGWRHVGRWPTGWSGFIPPTSESEPDSPSLFY
jgi:hypothetical protein